MRNNNVTLKEALDQMVKDLKLKPKLDEARIKTCWLELMGKPIAKYTTEVSLKRGKLYVKIESAALKQELSFSRDKIKDLFNRELGEDIIKDVLIY